MNDRSILSEIHSASSAVATHVQSMIELVQHAAADAHYVRAHPKDRAARDTLRQRLRRIRDGAGAALAGAAEVETLWREFSEQVAEREKGARS